tara:strand:- start:1754 stop:3892 length:2139 start_codon:yes stop_codon:yes gene_type:complete
MHLPYNSVVDIIDLQDRLLVQSDIGVYTFDLKSGEITLLTKVDGLSETAVTNIGYSKNSNTIVLTYDNGDIDLIKDNTIINIPAIKRASIVGAKEIYELKIYNSIAYLATSFGVVVLDLEKEEVVDDYQNLGSGGASIPIYSIALLDNNLYVGTAEGIKRAPNNDSEINLKNFESWETVGQYDSAVNLISYSGSVYFTHDDNLVQYSGGVFSILETQVDYRSVSSSQGKLLVCRAKGIMQIDANGQRELGEAASRRAIYDSQGNLWFGGFYTGLIKKDAANNYSYVSQRGPYGASSYDMLGDGNKMWVTSGGHTSAFSPSYISTGVYTYEDGLWTNLKLTDTGVASMVDLTNLYIDELEVYIGSFGSGLLQLENGKTKIRYTPENSMLKEAVSGRAVALGMVKDSKGNLWVSNYDTNRPLLVRRPNGTWEDFNVGVKRLGEMIVDDYDQVWIIVPRNSSAGILVVREEEDQFESILLNTTSGGLPNNNVKALAKDKDGEIWIGTETGIAVVYNPSLVFDRDPNGDAQQIIIDDGNDIGFLLGNEVVNDIKIDGGNRKWIATNNGVWLVKEDGSAVISHLTSETTPLPNNNVNCVGIVPNTGEVFFGTNSGIASFRSDATEANQNHGNTLVFPNPVDKGYEGPITISGLPEDATVKIVDVAGRVVYELIANGGTAVWDGRNFSGQLPQTGVYLIFSGNKENDDTLVSKLLIVR